MRTNRFVTLCLAVVLAALCADGGLAIPAITGVTGGGLATSASDQVFGWQFTVSSAVDVTALGALDDDLDGMGIAHDIGIFRVSDQSLVVATTLDAGSGGLLEGGFRYESLPASVALAAGSYVIVMTMPDFNADFLITTATAVDTAPEISYLGSAVTAGNSLAYPTIFGFFLFEEGIFGPNFQFDRAEPSEALIPEPATLALLSLGIGGLSVSRRKRRAS